MPARELEQRLSSLSIWVTAGICFLFVFAVSVMGVIVWQSVRVSENADRLEKVAVETHDALCAFKLDLQRRYDTGVQLLKEHPEDPVRAFNLVIPRSTLVTSRNNQKSTLDTLSQLECP